MYKSKTQEINGIVFGPSKLVLKCFLFSLVDIFVGDFIAWAGFSTFVQQIVFLYPTLTWNVLQQADVPTVSKTTQPTNILKTQLFDDIPPFLFGGGSGWGFLHVAFLHHTTFHQKKVSPRFSRIFEDSTIFRRSRLLWKRVQKRWRPCGWVLSHGKSWLQRGWQVLTGRWFEFFDVFLLWKNIKPLGGGNSNIYDFQHEPWGDDPIWLLHIFQMGWWNHQLVHVKCIFFSKIHAVSVRLPNTWVFWRYCMYQDPQKLKRSTTKPQEVVGMRFWPYHWVWWYICMVSLSPGSRNPEFLPGSQDVTLEILPSNMGRGFFFPKTNMTMEQTPTISRCISCTKKWWFSSQSCDCFQGFFVKRSDRNARSLRLSLTVNLAVEEGATWVDDQKNFRKNGGGGGLVENFSTFQIENFLHGRRKF